MKVGEYAVQAEISPRRVRALIAQGRLPATRGTTADGSAARSWDIKSPVLPSRTRRPLSTESQVALAGALREHTLAGLTGQTRARTATRIRALRASDNPAALLIDWWGGVAPVTLTGGNSFVLQAMFGDKEMLKHRVHVRPTEYLRRRERLAEIVSSERTIQQLTRQELADRAETSVAVVSAIEQGKDARTIGGMSRILRALGIQTTALPDWDFEK